MADLIVVTGASGGIGFEIAKKFAGEGIELALVGRSASLAATVERLGKTASPVHSIAVDLASPDKVRAGVAEFLHGREHRRLGVVLCASLLGPSTGTREADLQAFEEVFRVNVVGNLAVVKASLPNMLQSGYGRCVFFAGGGAAYAYPLFPAYALSKVATVRLVENLAAEYSAAKGLSFVCVAPGAVETPMLQKVKAAGGEVKTTTHVSEVVGFASEYMGSESRAINGRYIHVRDDWSTLLKENTDLGTKRFYLRRIE